ncbi:TPA: class I SAM-dependent methyltransferase, partial [Candidatus Micrarchaeota archaeon]|nr:class I SAM-dependent methyltransferase [Candidatus Micrarchaeota archaeon]
ESRLGLVRLSSHFSGPRILDAGCGPGYVLGTFVRDWMATDFDVGARPNTTILSVDVSPESIEQAKARYERYLKYELLRADRSNPKKDRTLAQYVNAKFLQQDFMKLDPDVVWEMLGGPPSTILASYFISWVSKDKIGAAMQLAMLAGPGTKLVIVEEPDQTITTTGKYMDEVQASRIEQYIDPIESLDLYIDLLRRAGWVEIPDADVELPIGKEELQKQRKHTVRCKAFEIPLID